MYEKSMDGKKLCLLKFYPSDTCTRKGMFFDLNFLLFDTMQVGVGFLAQYLVKPLLGFLIAMVSLYQLMMRDHILLLSLDVCVLSQLNLQCLCP